MQADICHLQSLGAKTIHVFRACLGAQLTICAQKLRNFVLFSTVSLRFVLSRVCVFLYSLGPRSPSDSVNVRMIPLLTHMSALFIIQSIARHNRNGGNIHPCFTPVLISNSWPHITFVLNPSYTILMMVTILQGVP